MLISNTVSPRMTTATLARALEQKRAVEEVSNTAPAIMRLNASEKYQALFEALITQHQTGTETPEPSAPSFPVEV